MNFSRRRFSYLGHVISENGVLPDKTTTKVIKEFPAPKNVKQLRPVNTSCNMNVVRN